MYSLFYALYPPQSPCVDAHGLHLIVKPHKLEALSVYNFELVEVFKVY